MQDFGLNLQDPNERFMHGYLVRATKGPEPMWHLLSFRRQSSVLLCVVRWLHSGGKTDAYSLVHLELQEPALRWKDFPTVEAAAQAMEQLGSAQAAQPWSPRMPPLLPVQVRSAKPTPQASSREPSPEASRACCMTVFLPTGVRIQMGRGIPKQLLHTVLCAVRALPC